ncbi:aminotransferase [Actinophytocola xinjiangensis]|uniref:Aminotransferase n=1 Tax=Actinophytocola xinjiangensis TaxID=485602 RepID=A0A7Z0WSV2_9PSEU|nr:histidinol-phosphate transaminase [Actinophytocola xinjiangensis]OLF14189.1 aminotransferase [Actinophytocola xinjiangensis]
MAVRIRPELAQTPGYTPAPVPPDAILLANNEVPGPPLPGVPEAVAAATGTLHRYPDATSTPLAAGLARHLGVAPDRVVVGAGSAGVCLRVLQALCEPGDEVAFGWRSFELYPLLARTVGAVPRPVPLSGDRLDLDALASATGRRTRVVLLCNPNNPTGTAVTGHELTRFLAAVPPHVLVVVDEAYREFATPGAVPDAVVSSGRHPRVAVLRTFSKAYGLAALRVGYGVLPVEVADAVRRVAPPFGVSTVAEAAASAALAAHPVMLARCRELAAERDRVRTALLAAGHRVPVSQANFLWLPLGERTSEFVAHCRDRGIVVRGYAGEGVRVTVGTASDNDAFLAAAT